MLFTQHHRSFAIIFIWSAIASGAQSPQLSLTVFSPDGKSAAGALAVLVPPGHSAQVTDGRTFDDDPAYVRATADSAGHLIFPNPPNSFLLVIIHTTGSTQLNQDELLGKERVALTTWGSVVGRRYIGDKPGAGCKIIAWASRGGGGDTAQYDPHIPTAVFVGNAIADSRGNYVIDRMSPGDVCVAPNDPANWGQSLERPMHVANVHPSMATTMDIGGTGRPVNGRVSLPSQLLNRHDWTYWFCTAFIKLTPDPSPMPKELQNHSLSEQIAWWTAFNQTPGATKRAAAKQDQYKQEWAGLYPFDIQPDGTFRIDDVSPGNYTIRFDVITVKTGTTPRTKLAEGNAEFTVGAFAGGRSDKPLELAPIPVEMVKGVRVGDIAPDFTVTGFNDKPLQLSSFRGKYVVLEFWATWCGPCVSEMDDVKAVYDKFGADRRFAMIGLSADESPDRPAHYATDHGLNWHQGFLGGLTEDSPIEKLYDVEGIPSIWLIGPDGKVIRRNLNGETLMGAVTAALSK